MGITIKKARLQLVLEEAVALAESDGDLPEIWLKRVERISSSPSRTYIAALGTALLAKAADERVDALAIKSKAGTNAYSMRGVVAVLAARASDYGYHLGVTGPEPLNNQPWFGSSRVDRITNLSAQVQPFHRDLVRYLSDLNRLSSDEALKALACFMRLRIAYNKEERAQETLLRTPARDSFEDLLDILETFVLNDPETVRMNGVSAITVTITASTRKMTRERRNGARGRGNSRVCVRATVAISNPASRRGIDVAPARQQR